MDSKLFVKDFTDLISQKYCFYCGKIEEVICAQCILLQVNNSKIHLINNYVGTYLPLTKWVKDILEEEKEGILKKIQEHSFKEQ
jgi:hypothetical protein